MLFELVVQARMGERSPSQISRALSDRQIQPLDEVFNVDESSEWLSASSKRHEAPINARRSTFTRRCCMNTGKLLIPLNLRILPHNRNLLIPLGLSESCNNAALIRERTKARVLLQVAART